ncbi:MAG: nucleoside-diphosphate sugar epimerase/dehydratase [Novosphingobium sp.]
MILNRLHDLALGLPRVGKRVLAVLLDTLLCVATVLCGYYLRLGYWILPTGIQLLPIAVSIILAIPLFIRVGLYRAIFRYSGRAALGALALAGSVYGATFATVFTFIGIDKVPRTLGLIQPILLIAAVGMSRVAVRFWLGGGYAQIRAMNSRSRVLIYGAGRAGRQLAAALAGSSEMRVVGFVDDDTSLHDSLLNGQPIHPADRLEALIATEQVGHVLLAMPSATRARRSEILSVLKHSAVQVRTLPDLNDIARGRVTVNDLRELDIEDLLGRDPVTPNPVLLGRNVLGKTVLVSGAGGSIGSELCRRIMRLGPRCLILYDVSEPALYAVHRELVGIEPAGEGIARAELVPLLGSVTDAKRLTSIMAAFQPDTIYHAAAYKHVPLVEHNPGEGLHNNVFGTLTTAQVAQAHGVSDFVLISTDKAVRPTNVMGASKRLSEMALQALAAEGGKTRFSMVRFGNVLGSSGSVVPLFRKQIREGGPLTITHTDITRYFMSIPEAAELVIQAGSMAHGGEVFVLDMGEPVRIVDLARNMIELSGLRVRDAAAPDGDIEIAVVGLRPGEKLYEELLISAGDQPTDHPRIMKAREPMLGWAELSPKLDELASHIARNDAQAVRRCLQSLVPEFAPTDAVCDFVYLRQETTASA